MYARARNEVNSRDFVIAMYARARSAVISIACKGSRTVNVVHTMAQNFCNFQGSCGACKAQNAVISRGSTYFNSQNFLHARVQNALISKVFVHARAQNAAIS